MAWHEGLDGWQPATTFQPSITTPPVISPSIQPIDEAKPKSRKGLLIGLAIGAVLLLGGLIGAYFIFQNAIDTHPDKWVRYDDTGLDFRGEFPKRPVKNTQYRPSPPVGPGNIVTTTFDSQLGGFGYGVVVTGLPPNRTITATDEMIFQRIMDKLKNVPDLTVEDQGPIRHQNQSAWQFKLYGKFQGMNKDAHVHGIMRIYENSLYQIIVYHRRSTPPKGKDHFLNNVRIPNES